MHTEQNKIKNEENRDMPYEKFLRLGPEALTERELLAIILRTGTPEKSAMDLAGEVLSLAKYPREGLLGLYDVTAEELMQIKGIGEVKAVKLKCLTELSMRISRSSAKEGLVFNSPGLVAQYFMELLRHRDTECVYLVGLDTRGRLIGEKKISEGSVRMSLISPREIFLEALRMHAVNILLVHNHPSGDPTPGKYDRELTQNVSSLGAMMDILLLDHIIIGDNRYTSFKELGYLT
ncbi:MAG: DNA repair protein RadC [Acetatifactor sp.]|nr:DNA repair protein RadC [Acetatifactor sp.]